MESKRNINKKLEVSSYFRATPDPGDTTELGPTDYRTDIAKA